MLNWTKTNATTYKARVINRYIIFVFVANNETKISFQSADNALINFIYDSSTFDGIDKLYDNISKLYEKNSENTYFAHLMDAVKNKIMK